MDSLHPDLQRDWLRTVVLLTLVTTLCILLRHATWPGLTATTETASDPVIAPAAEPAPPSSPPAVKALLFPLAGYSHALRDNFHEKRGVRTHKALDIMAPRGTPVRAVDDGSIAKLYRGPLAGIAVYQFDPESRRIYFYAHLDRYAAALKEGQAISRGDVIGYVGSTGNAPESAPHLHFEMRVLGTDKRWWRGEAINPYELLRAAEG